MTEYQFEAYMIELLLIRLERISVDSHLAHRASGIRGALIRQLEAIKLGKAIDATSLKQLISTGFFIVESAASQQG